MAEIVSSISTSSALRAVEFMCKQWLNDAVHACLAQPCVRCCASAFPHCNTTTRRSAIDQCRALFLPVLETGTALSDVAGHFSMPES
jgi:hypothetical protein